MKNLEKVETTDFNEAYTDIDIENTVEGYALRKEHKFEKMPKKTTEEKVVDAYMESMDVEYCAREFNMSLGKVTGILKDYGVI